MEKQESINGYNDYRTRFIFTHDSHNVHPAFRYTYDQMLGHMITHKHPAATWPCVHYSTYSPTFSSVPLLQL